MKKVVVFLLFSMLAVFALHASFAQGNFQSAVIIDQGVLMITSLVWSIIKPQLALHHSK